MGIKGRTLTKTGEKKKSNILVSKQKLDRRFVVAFKYRLQNGYGLDELQKDNLKELQRFLDKISKMNVSDVDKQFKRKNDKNDSFEGQQVHHYEVSKKFRIHGIIEEGRFKVIRLDPNHKVHK